MLDQDLRLLLTELRQPQIQLENAQMAVLEGVQRTKRPWGAGPTLPSFSHALLVQDGESYHHNLRQISVQAWPIQLGRKARPRHLWSSSIK